MSEKNIYPNNTIPQNITVLNISNNRSIKHLPKLPSSLTYLDVRYNELISLPKLPSSLTYLDVRYNELISLPELPSSLTYLDVIYNDLIRLPEFPLSLTYLDVRGNWLTSLPELPSSLKHLNVSSNKLTSLPELPSSLEYLDVGFNKLTSLPELPLSLTYLDVIDNKLTSIPELPSFLKHVSAFHNKLISLPELPSSLEYLYVNYNELTSLPELPSSLIGVNFNNNLLTRIPSSIFRLTIGFIELQGNSFSYAEINRINGICNSPNYTGPRIHFGVYTKPLTEIPSLHKIVQSCSNANIDSWKRIEKEENSSDFARFLYRLKDTINYTDTGFKENVSKWLIDLTDNKQLRDLTFDIATDSTQTCEDRVSMYYNKMKSLYIINDIETGKYDTNPSKILKLARGFFNLDEIYKIAQEKVKSLNFVDEIEVYLAFEVKLQSILDLPVETPLMRFYGVSWVTQEDLDNAVKRVRNAEGFEKYLVTSWYPFTSVLKRICGEEMYKLACEQVLELFEHRLPEKIKNVTDEDVIIQLGALLKTEIEIEVMMKLWNDCF